MDKVKEIQKLGALNLRQDPAKLEEFELVKLSNFDVSRKPGSLVLRRGKETLYSVSAATGDIVRQIAKINGFRYQVAGDQLFRDGVAITRDLATASERTDAGNLKNLETNFQAFRPLNDTTIWAFVADDNLMIKDSDEGLRLWGIDLIPTPKPQLANQTGKVSTDTITAGTYRAAVTQIRWDNS